jgi:hypothetical protein
MSGYTDIFDKKTVLLKERLLNGRSFEQLQNDISPLMRGGRGFAAFVSVCDTRERARVFRCAADSPEEAWNGAVSSARQHISSKNLEPVWVKADITHNSESASTQSVIEQIAAGYHEMFRRGISFDGNFETALIEAEINGNRVISYKKDTIELAVVNKYLSACGLKTLSELPEEVVLFDCVSAFCDDENAVYELYGSGNDCGRRVISRFDKQTALDVVSSSSEYLSMMIGLDGKFDYGYYPIYHKEIPGYNILRHASSIWSLICSYRLTGDRFTLAQIENAVGYMIRNTFYKYRDCAPGTNTVYLADKHLNEIKVGGNAVAVVMLTEYMDATGSDKYVNLAQELGNGILELFDARTGEFFHVLNYPSMSPKDKFRTVYYDGESVFALCRLYGLTKDRKWLDAATLAVDRFIREDYTKFRDHWVAYAMNEITKYLPKEKYLNFALKNAQVNLKKIYNQPTTYHTYLELLCVTFELYERIADKKLKCSYLEKFDVDFFVKTIYRRAEYMLNGYGYPEYVMYFRHPDAALGAFFVRHDGYRIRIDDIQHYCGAYYSFYRNYEKLEELRTAAEKENNPQ